MLTNPTREGAPSIGPVPGSERPDDDDELFFDFFHPFPQMGACGLRTPSFWQRENGLVAPLGTRHS